MTSRQLLHLQQQFLRSLHSQPTPWLLEQVRPAAGFGGDAREVIELYLKRAMARTVDPLHGIFGGCRWLLGADGLDQLLERFYAFSPGEPINAQQLAYECIGFLSSLPEGELEGLLQRTAGQGMEARQAVLEVAMLDWRLSWASLAPPRDGPGVEGLRRQFRERNHRWGRPRLQRGARLALTGYALAELWLAIAADAPLECLPVRTDGPGWYLIQIGRGGVPEVLGLPAAEARLLSGCNGTNTVAALCHQESFFGESLEAVETRLLAWVEAEVVVELQTEIGGGVRC
ncbi:putative DNA-binding domain-containing protein [Synechococcus sp. CS-1328]|uniref:HvfC/BufC family peptide modification chaperone n=1 Tax=Synechococcus sp. CS-1328 TaxID=2847976 RepID=UPI00223BC852|nr:putative DNA-binding domain-containing protein [Synechococcus sp. CS-1328]MCT0225786.1 putative DNA-binding domain-containing protein [Synechococcus sp. CS-1328]MCT0225815.1 putative DNA-binding domain-containing protein [Synechococcus sp. CS-1328]